MKAYLIRPEQRTIEAVDYDGDYRSIYTLCGWQTFDMIRLDGGNVIAVDDEGMHDGPLHFFLLGDYPRPLCGNALVIGPEENEEDEEDTRQLDCTLTIEQLTAAVTFIDTAQAVEIYNQVRRDQQSDMAVMRARGMSVVDASVGLSLDEEGNVRMHT